MRHFFLTVLGTIVGIFAFIVVFFIFLVLFATVSGVSAATKSKASYVLSLDLRKPLRDHSSGSQFFGPSLGSVVDIARALNRAKDDKLVKGLFIRANEFGMVPASAEEIRLAIKDFKSSGKFVITHAQGFESPSIMPYHAISASDEIWLQDTTGFSVAGIRSESEFYGGVFEKFDAKPQFEQFYEYKSAANSYTQKGYTDAHREASTSYLTSLFDNSVAQISQDRGLSAAELEQLLQNAPHSAEQALAKKMVDKLGHVEEAREYARTKAGGKKIKFKSVTDYGPGN